MVHPPSRSDNKRLINPLLPAPSPARRGPPPSISFTFLPSKKGPALAPYSEALETLAAAIFLSSPSSSCVLCRLTLGSVTPDSFSSACSFTPLLLSSFLSRCRSCEMFQM